MPVPTTADAFFAIVRKSGLVDAAAMDGFVGRWAAAGANPAGARDIADLLIRDGLLTQLQAVCLLRGGWRNLIINGKYKLLEHLGSGGMGRVYLCEQTALRRLVAVKILPPERSGDPVSLQRFIREARVAAALDHPNIVRAHDIDSFGPLHFIVMEYVDGSTLQEVVRRVGPLPVARACHYIHQVATGLHYAHAHGLVHRDIKPANLLLNRAGVVKILDLGLARLAFDPEDQLTRNLGARHLIGTADYLAPEQAKDGHAADIRADIYSLGITAYFLLTGRSPFKDGTVTQKLLYHQTCQPEPVRSYRPDVPAELAAVLDRMMAKNPADRFRAPGDVAAALGTWAGAAISPPADVEMPRRSRTVRSAGPSTHPTVLDTRPTSHEYDAPGPRPAARPARWFACLWSAIAAAPRAALRHASCLGSETRAADGPSPMPVPLDASKPVTSSHPDAND
jgi:serine/threonine protein kinase